MNAPAIPPHDTPPSEAFSVLQALAQRHTGPIPPDLLAPVVPVAITEAQAAAHADLTSRSRASPARRETSPQTGS